MLQLNVILYNIRNIYNVGSIFRTADGAGANKIYLCGITPAPLDRFNRLRPQFAKVALGAERQVAWDASARSLPATLKLIASLKNDGAKIFALEQTAVTVPYQRGKFLAGERKPGKATTRGKRGARKAVLILGNEVRGLPGSILKRADAVLEIPMRGSKESLNVAVAFGIAAYSLVQ